MEQTRVSNLTAVKVRVPATTANLGPGFDSLALALDLWNEVIFQPSAGELHIEVRGEGQGRLALDGSNLVLKAVRALCERVGRPIPRLVARCDNHIPLGSGLGSSAAASLAGLMGANAWFGAPLSRDEILAMVIDLEGHPDNAAAALYGGLVTIAASPDGAWLVRRVDLPRLNAVVVLPDFDFPTRTARAALPRQVRFEDAVFNMGHALLVSEALRSGDLHLLGLAMQDRLHQPYRLPLIPGAAEAIQAARAAGAAACAISGAGPSLIAFTKGDAEAVGASMASEFDKGNIAVRTFLLTTSNCGVECSPLYG